MRLPDSFTGHATARVEGDTKTHRYALSAEVRHGLGLIIFVHDEVVFAQAGDEPSGLIEDTRGNVDQFHAALESKSGVRILRDRLLLRRHVHNKQADCQDGRGIRRDSG